MAKTAPPALPVVCDPPSPRRAQSGATAKVDAAFAAQTLGQTGQRRGLKGGAPVLDAARSAYLKAQWSGPGDRRLTPGAVTEDEV